MKKIDTMRGKAKKPTWNESTTVCLAPDRRTGNSGRVGLIVLMGVLLAAGLAAFFQYGGQDRSGLDGEPQTETAEATASTSNAGSPIRAGTRSTPERQITQTKSARTTLPDMAFGSGHAPDPDRFVGTGELRGGVQVIDASAPPDEWTLELIPSRFMTGSKSAIEHTQIYTAGSLEFKVEHLPFGAYEARAVAHGFNGSWVTATIDRTSTSPFVNLSLRAAGFLEGYLVDGQSLPLGELDVVLVAQADGAQFETRSDTLGKWRIDAVPDGVYELLVGPATAPLTRPERIQFRAPSMTFPPIEIKGLGSVTLTVLDEQEIPILDAHVTGHSTGGGHIDVTTDAFGVALFGNLGPGTVRFKISHPDWMTRRGAVELKPGGQPAMVLKLARPR